MTNRNVGVWRRYIGFYLIQRAAVSFGICRHDLLQRSNRAILLENRNIRIWCRMIEVVIQHRGAGIYTIRHNIRQVVDTTIRCDVKTIRINDIRPRVAEIVSVRNAKFVRHLCFLPSRNSDVSVSFHTRLWLSQNSSQAMLCAET